MTRWKLVVPHTIIQICLLSACIYILLLALSPCKLSRPLAINDTVFMVLAVATVVLTFPVGWLALPMFSLLFYYFPVFLFVVIVLCYANALLWGRFLQAWREFWDRFEDRRNRLRR